MEPRAWYRFQNAAADPTVAELSIYGDIGASYWDDDAVSAKQFLDDLKGLPDAVTKICVRVNSLGGSVFDAVAIANALREQTRAKGRTVETTVDGIAASAATIVIMAGSVIRIADNAMLMVHNPWTLGYGNAAEMRKLADTLDAIRNTIVATYKWHSQLSDDELVALMDAETWMDADQAVANGFATDKIEGLKAAAALDAKSLAKLTIPDKFKARVDALLKKETPAPVAASATDVLTAVEAAHLDTAFARELVAAALPMDQVTARIEAAVAERTQREQAETEARTAREARNTEIRTICATAKLPELADGYIAGAMPPEAVRAHVLTITAKLDTVEIDGSLRPDAGRAGQPTIDASAIYASRNQPKK